MREEGEYVQALEDECARANAFIGVLRLAARTSSHPEFAAPTYPMYEGYTASRERRFDLDPASANG